ncbi:hypothetical protein E2C01_060551 [Portunus trituberculatus]|uniref:Uncharacterized protein n=1 Tax=Portunus trituberculatus TaxID=210409 RepID=A0A5B7HCE9_PORTR|nr:hypothetical protein [Portunus trituberculatus]
MGSDFKDIGTYEIEVLVSKDERSKKASLQIEIVDNIPPILTMKRLRPVSVSPVERDFAHIRLYCSQCVTGNKRKQTLLFLPLDDLLNALMDEITSKLWEWKNSYC